MRVEMKPVHSQNRSRRSTGPDRTLDKHPRTTRIRKMNGSATRNGTTQAAGGFARTLEHIRDTADCLLSFGQFLEEAKPEEIRLLSDMLAQWSNWSGSLRAGNFFRAVAEGVLSGDVEKRVRSWLNDDARLRAAQVEVRRGSAALGPAAGRNGAGRLKG